MPKINSQWRRGPTNDVLIEAHDRPINCISIDGNEVVTGSSDHSLKVLDISKGSVKRELYSKKHGHTDWVTTVDHLKEDGRILSGGMDSRLCLWNANSNKCISLNDHKGSISQVQCGENNIALSSSYDKTVKIWDLDEPKCLNTLRNDKYGHTKAIQNFYWKNSLVVSGGRDALCCIWDINTGKHVSTLEEHVAPIQTIGALSHQDTNVLVTGAMDGCVCIWDLRTAKLIENVDVKASVNDIKISNPLDHKKSLAYPQIVVGNTDKTIRILDMKKGFKIRTECAGHKDVITTLCLVNDLIISGGGNGWCLVHDMTGACLYGVLADDKSVSVVGAAPPKHFVAGGEDGSLVVFGY